MTKITWQDHLETPVRLPKLDHYIRSADSSVDLRVLDSGQGFPQIAKMITVLLVIGVPSLALAHLQTLQLIAEMLYSMQLHKYPT